MNDIVLLLLLLLPVMNIHLQIREALIDCLPQLLG